MEKSITYDTNKHVFRFATAKEILQTSWLNLYPYMLLAWTSASIEFIKNALTSKVTETLSEFVSPVIDK